MNRRRLGVFQCGRKLGKSGHVGISLAVVLTGGHIDHAVSADQFADVESLGFFVGEVTTAPGCKIAAQAGFLVKADGIAFLDSHRHNLSFPFNREMIAVVVFAK